MDNSRLAQMEPPPYPIRAVQFGEGNFLRAFADVMIDAANEKGVFKGCIAIVKPREGSVDAFRGQNCNYTVILRGAEDGRVQEERRVVTSVKSVYSSDEDYREVMKLAWLGDLQVIISNTTEAGIVFDRTELSTACPPRTFPGKLTKFLYERYRRFRGSHRKGLLLLPTELVENNGMELYRCVQSYAKLWGLEERFLQWLDTSCFFCDTLADRVVAGFPAEEKDRLEAELGYEDPFMTVGEAYGLWVIRCDAPQKAASIFPLHLAGMPLEFTADYSDYRERKVRIANGFHSAAAPAAFLAGLDTVGECLRDQDVSALLRRLLFEEIIPLLPGNQEALLDYAEGVLARFSNPAIRHSLVSISLNSIAKWKTRLLPSLKDYCSRNGKPPEALCFCFAALLAFYRGGTLEKGSLLGNFSREHRVQDECAILQKFLEASGLPAEQYVEKIAGDPSLWGCSLADYLGFLTAVSRYCRAMLTFGVRGAIQRFNDDSMAGISAG